MTDVVPLMLYGSYTNIKLTLIIYERLLGSNCAFSIFCIPLRQTLAYMPEIVGLASLDTDNAWHPTYLSPAPVSV